MKAARFVVVFVFVSLLFPFAVYADPPAPMPMPTESPVLGDAGVDLLSEIEMLTQEGGVVSSLDIQGQYAYVGIGLALNVYDISNAQKPVRVAQMMLKAYVLEIEVSDGWAYVFTNPDSPSPSDTVILRVLDIRDPLNPIVVGSVPLPASPNEILASADLLYITTNKHGLFVVDVSMPHAPAIIDHVLLTTELSDLVMVDNYLYAIGYNTGIAVFSLADPRKPALVNTYADPEWAMHIEYVDGYLYTSSCENKLTIFDIADRRRPVRVGTLNPGYCPRSISIVDGYLYVTTEDRGLVIHEISDPVAPVEVHRVEQESPYMMVTAGQGSALLADIGMLSFVDITEPRTAGVVVTHHTVIEGSAEPPVFPDEDFPGLGSVLDVVYRENFAYVSGSALGGMSRGIYIFDVSNPDEAKLIGENLMQSTLSSIAVDGPYLYGADAYMIDRGAYTPGGLFVFDVSEPGHPLLVDWIELPSSGPHLTANDGVITVTSFSSGRTDFRFGTSQPGTLVDALGEPLPNLAISMGKERNAVTDAEGRFVFHALPRGGHRLTLADPSLRTVDASALFSPPSWSSNNPWTYHAMDAIATVPAAAADWQWVIIPERVSGEYAPGIDVSLTMTNARGMAATISVPGEEITQSVEVRFEQRMPSFHLGLAPTSHAFELGMSSLGAEDVPLPVRVSLQYSDTDLRWISNEAALDLYVYAEDGWQQPSTACVPDAARVHDGDVNYFAMTVCDPGIYALMGPRTQIFLPMFGDW